MSSTIIVGAGVTGLALAHRLLRDGQDVVVLEAADRVGGPLHTARMSGLQFELGPQSFRSGGGFTTKMIEQLSLQDRIVPAAANKRFILWDGKLREVPRGLLSREFMPVRGLVRALAEPTVRRRTPPSPTESVYDFMSRRFGNRVAERLVDPFVAGIHAGDSRRIEMAAAFPDLWDCESRYGSLIVGLIGGPRTEKKPSWAPKVPYSLKSGMQSFPDAIAGSLGGQVKLATPAEKIVRDGSGWRVETPSGPFQGNRLVVTVPPAQAKGLFDFPTPLADMPTALVGAVTLAYKASETPSPSGFGWLCPSSQRSDVLGVLYVSSMFPEATPGRTTLRVMLGGARQDISGMTDDQLMDQARKVLREVEHIDVAPAFVHVQRAALPQYERHYERFAQLCEATPGISWLGWGYTGIGIEHGMRAAAQWT